MLDRPRHEKLIADIRATGARIRLIGDGDLSAGIAAAVVGTGVHAVMGIGGAPEGVLTAAAMRCLNGEIFARLVVSKPEHEERCRAMGITDFKTDLSRRRISRPATSIIFAATGVTDGTLMKGVRFFGDGIRTSSVIMQNDPHQIRFIDSIHVGNGATPRSSFRIRASSDASRRSSIPTRRSAMRCRKRRHVRSGAAASSRMPTDTLYGLAADPFNAPAVARVFAVKGRAADRALPLDRRRHRAGRGAARRAAAATARGWRRGSGRDR